MRIVPCIAHIVSKYVVCVCYVRMLYLYKHILYAYSVTSYRIHKHVYVYVHMRIVQVYGQQRMIRLTSGWLQGKPRLDMNQGRCSSLDTQGFCFGLRLLMALIILLVLDFPQYLITCLRRVLGWVTIPDSQLFRAAITYTPLREYLHVNHQSFIIHRKFFITHQ